MKILLTAVNAKYIHSNPAIYSLKAYAEKKEPSLAGQIELAEYTINHSVGDILSDIYFRKPDVIGFSCYIWNIRYVAELAQEAKKILPDVQIWFGGPEVSFDAVSLLEKYPFLTGVIKGEGEETFLELARTYAKIRQTGRDFAEAEFDEIKGVAVRQGGVAAETQERPPAVLSELPFLYEETTPFENRIIYYESGRGCPFRCSYCLSSIDKTVRLRDLEIVKKELAFFLEKKVRQVKFVDRTFNCNKEHALSIWNYILENDNGVTNFHFEIAADLLGEEELAVLERFRPGAVQLEIGVQSTNPKTLREIDRHMDAEKLAGVVKRIRSGKNIHVHLDLIAGLPYEDYLSFAKSFNDVFAMEPEQLQLGFLKVLKGSKMHKKAKEYGLVYRSKPAYEVLFTDWLSYEDVCRLKRIEEMVELYYNSNQFTTTLPLAIRLFESPFAFFEALADFYEKQGYFVQSPARSYRYQVLLSFLEEKVEKTEENIIGLYRESLSVDLYLRENCKTRPEFAPDMTESRGMIRNFFQKEAADHDVLGEAYADFDARMLARTVHVEPVTYDFKTGKRREKKEYILFDYKKRNALTGEANIYMIGNVITDE
nr:B12-binding domain-containing radical SAM protein [Lachnospiraceae bacterium]